MEKEATPAKPTGRQRRSWDYAKTAIAPLDRVKILFQAANPEFQKYSGRWLGVVHAGRQIVEQQGPMGLFQGHSATLLRIFPYAAVKYMAYDALHVSLMPTAKDETAARLFLAGSVSGVLSVFLTYPLELIRVRLAFDTKSYPHHKNLRTITSAIYHEGAAVASLDGKVVKNEGTPLLLNRFPLLKFYRGFTATVLGMIPYAGTSFLVFGRCKALLYRTILLQDTHANPLPGSADARPVVQMSRTSVDLASGALAGAISQTVSYPFEVIRRRQQVGGILRPSSMLRLRETVEWIYTTNGLRGFYVGLGIGYMKVIPMTAISFAVWSSMKRYLNL